MAEKKTKKKTKKKVEDVITVERDGRDATIKVAPSSFPRRLESRMSGKDWEFMYDVPTKGAEFKIDTRRKRILEVRIVRIIQTKKL